jgi:hypothetical protein
MTMPMTFPVKKRLASVVLLGSLLTTFSTHSHASPYLVILDLTSGALSNQRGAPVGFDTYDESGFHLRMDRPGDHMDADVLGSDLYFHNGPSNPDNITWRLSYGGSAFNFFDIDITGLFNGGTALTITGSNSNTEVLTSAGEYSLFGFSSVTWVKFDLSPDGGDQAVGFNSLVVGTTGAPEPGTLGLLGLGISAALVLKRRQQQLG